MLYLIVYVILFLIFLGAPWPLQLLFFVLNLFIRDPIPIVDEALMGASVIKKLSSVVNVLDFAKCNPKKFAAIAGAALVLIVVLIKIFI